MREQKSTRLDRSRGCARLLGLALLALAGCGGSGDTGETSGPPQTTSSSTGGDVPPTPVDHAASEACTVFPQAGCPADHTCTVATADGKTICESAGSAAVAGACGSDDDCALGLACVGSVCRAFCHQGSDCGGTAPACFPVYHDSTPIPGWTSCSVACNPADPGNSAGTAGLLACPAGTGCYTLDASVGPQGSTDCFVVGDAKEGASCADVACAAGLVCLNDAGSKSCRPLCIKDVSSCSCLSFAQPDYAAISGSIKEVGYCQ